MSASAKFLIVFGFAGIILVAPEVIRSEFWLNWLVLSLFFSLLGIAWNLLGGYGGQYSFGHAAFFGIGGYVMAIGQVHGGIGPWLLLPLAALGAGLVGLAIGGLSFRYGLKGSYFALVTLAFAEVFRVLATSAPFTGAGAGILVPLRREAAALQFETKAGYLYFALVLVVAGLAVSIWLEHSRFGARLAALRENEDAARALGVDVLRTKLGAIFLSATLAGLAGAFYVQYFLFLDAGIAFGPGMSVEALLSPIVGGIGTVFGPVIGAFVLHLVAEIARHLIGDAPGLALALYGAILIVMVLFVPRGLAGLLKRRHA